MALGREEPLAQDGHSGNGAQKTPFIIKLPGAKANGKRIEAPVSLQDIFPTLVDLCGLEVEQELDGNSLKPLLSKPVGKLGIKRH